MRILIKTIPRRGKNGRLEILSKPKRDRIKSRMTEYAELATTKMIGSGSLEYTNRDLERAFSYVIVLDILFLTPFFTRDTLVTVERMNEIMNNLLDDSLKVLMAEGMITGSHLYDLMNDEEKDLVNKKSIVKTSSDEINFDYRDHLIIKIL
jgi:hypothetical protein